MNRAEKAVNTAFERASDRYGALSSRLAAQSPENKLKLMSEKVENAGKRLDSAFERYTEKRSAELSEKIARLDSLSPLKVMSRGYSLVYSGDELVRSSDSINEGDTVSLRFDNGGAEAKIVKKW